MGLDKILEVEKKLKEEIDKTYIDEVNSAISAFGSMIDLEDLEAQGISPIYTSSPITTGLLMYKQFGKYNVKTMEELIGINPNVRKELMNQNIQEGIRFGQEIRKRGFPIVITPGIFFAKGWAQEHYMSLWKSVIVDKASIVVYDDNFHYSDGCAEEFLIGLQYNKELRSRKGFEIINPKDEIPKFEEAITQIERKIGQIPKKLYNSYTEIVKLLE